MFLIKWKRVRQLRRSTPWRRDVKQREIRRAGEWRQTTAREWRETDEEYSSWVETVDDLRRERALSFAYHLHRRQRQSSDHRERDQSDLVSIENRQSDGNAVDSLDLQDGQRTANIVRVGDTDLLTRRRASVKRCVYDCLIRSAMVRTRVVWMTWQWKGSHKRGWRV